MERFNFIFLIGGISMFAFGFLTTGLAPWLMVTNNTANTTGEFSQVPYEFEEYFKAPEEYKEAVVRGKEIYKREACWHCHSQYVRPVSNESLYYGAVSTAGEYETDMQLPQLFGTRRVGPDLIRQAKKYGNDWHFAHFFRPRDVVPESVMPEYTWFFDKTDRFWVFRDDGSSMCRDVECTYANEAEAREAIEAFKADDAERASAENREPPKHNYRIESAYKPNADGIAIVAYVQWLGSWLPNGGRPDPLALTAK